jgi:hypothetical protein
MMRRKVSRVRFVPLPSPPDGEHPACAQKQYFFRCKSIKTGKAGNPNGFSPMPCPDTGVSRLLLGRLEYSKNGHILQFKEQT